MTRESECGDKVRYLSRKAAKDAIRQIRHRDGRLAAYPCSHCPFFHVGHFQLNSRLAARRRRTAST